MVPRVSIGLPVFNGGNYLAEALDSLVAQTCADFELIISDNGSTDGTERICREYAGRDPRIRYYRVEENRGAAWNFNRVFDLATAPYFKWAAHDDRCAPTYIEKCLEELEGDPSLVLCHSRVTVIDERGQPVEDYAVGLGRIDSPRPRDRFVDTILIRHRCYHVFGIMRRDVLARTPRIASYIGSDLPLLAELSLRGRFCELSQRLFISRDHVERSARATLAKMPAWFDPNRDGKVVFRYWRFLWEYLRCVRVVPLPLGERLACYARIGRWVCRYPVRLAEDFVMAARMVCPSPIRRALRSVWGRDKAPDHMREGPSA